MMRHIQRTVMFWFACSLAVLLAVGVASVLMTQKYLHDSEWNDHTRAVLIALDEMRTSLLEARGAARALLLDPAHNDIHYFTEARDRTHQRFAAVRELTADNPEQQRRLDELLPMIELRLQQLAEGIAVWNTRQDQARALVAGPPGQATMGEFQSRFDTLIKMEQDLLRERRATQNATAVGVLAITSAGAVLAVVLLSLAYWRIRLGLTDRARDQEQLLRARAEAESANRFKSDFLANMSHEIRTPVAAIIGYSDVLLDPDMNASERLICISTVRRNGMHLLTLINDILDLSKVEAGRLHVEQIECSPCLIIGDVASMMRVRASERNLPLEIKIEGVIPERITSDPMRLRQILINLLSNAIKFTEKGTVQLVVKLATPPDDPHPRLRFDVIDTGIGMSPEQIGQLFQPFVQGDASTTRRFGGTGLGLTISRRLAEYLGGEVSVRSVPGAGSTFTLQIKTGSLAGIRLISRCTESTYDVDSGEYRPAETVPPGSQGRVLIAEDGQDNRNLVSYVLRRAGYHVEFAENGRIAVQMAMDSERLMRPFDAVLMDMQMPELDGYAATAKLRSTGFPRPIIALTANAMKTDRDRCLAAGCSDYLGKPVDRRLLLQCLRRHIGNENAAAPATPAGSDTQEVKSVDDGMAQLRRDFILNLPVYIADLNGAVARGDGATAQRVLHQLSGIGGVFDFQWLTDEATPLDRALKSGKALESLQPQVAALVERIRGIEGYQVGLEKESDERRATDNRA